MKFSKIDNDNIYKLKNIVASDVFLKVIEQVNKKELDVYVIDNSGDFIGRIFVNYINRSLDNETIPGKRVCISHFFLKKEHRNNGLGTQLLDYVLKDLKEKGYTEFSVGVQDKNEIAKHIYFKRGFNTKINHGFEPAEYDLYLKK